MAAQEYYLGTQGAHELSGQNQPKYPSQQAPPAPQYQRSPAQPYPQQHFNAPTYAPSPPPSYSTYPQLPAPQKPQLQSYGSQQQYPTMGPQTAMAPYPQTPPQSTPFFPPPPQQQNSYLGVPLQPHRSHSQPAPPRVRFAEQDSDRSTELGSTSESDASTRHRRRHRRHRSHDRARDADRDSDYSDRDRDRDRDRRHRHKHSSSRDDKKEHKTRDTFLGAGAGSIIGDAIFPGLGTAAGLLLGGYGGRKYADRSKSEDPEAHHRRHRDGFREGQDEGRRDAADGSGHRHRDAYYERKEEGRRDREYKSRKDSYGDSDSEGGYKRSSRKGRRADDGWDEGSGTFKKGHAVR